MIIGIGIDIIDVRRINKNINQFGNRFIKKCFTQNEITRSDNLKNRAHSYAKRFAAKEAFTKALGLGFSKGIFYKDIEIINDKDGKPSIILYNEANLILKRKTKNACKIEVSLSDEKNYAIANVIIFENEKKK